MRKILQHPECEKCIEKLSDFISDYKNDRPLLNHIIEEYDIEISDDFCIAIEILKKIVKDNLNYVVNIEENISNTFYDMLLAMHDIREPLRSIKQLTSLAYKDIKNNKINEETLYYLEIVENSAQKMSNMINNVSMLLELGNTKDENHTILNFADILQIVKNDLYVFINENNAVINIDLENIPKVKGDTYRWIRIFSNLIKNGIQYNISQIPTITIWGDGEKIFVKDNGIGIPNGKEDIIFQIFTRLKDREEMSVTGTGAGLYLVKKFLLNDGYNISVDVSFEEGTIFIIDKI